MSDVSPLKNPEASDPHATVVLTVLFDLDETLVSAENLTKKEEEEIFSRLRKADPNSLPPQKIPGTELTVFTRPYWKEFIEYITELTKDKKVKMSIWTAASPSYAFWIIENIIKKNNPDLKIDWVFVSNNCDMVNGEKNLHFFEQKSGEKVAWLFDDKHSIREENMDPKTQTSLVVQVPEFIAKNKKSHKDKVLLYLKEIIGENFSEKGPYTAEQIQQLLHKKCGSSYKFDDDTPIRVEES